MGTLWVSGRGFQIWVLGGSGSAVLEVPSTSGEWDLRCDWVGKISSMLSIWSGAEVHGKLGSFRGSGILLFRV